VCVCVTDVHYQGKRKKEIDRQLVPFSRNTLTHTHTHTYTHTHAHTRTHAHTHTLTNGMRKLGLFAHTYETHIYTNYQNETDSQTAHPCLYTPITHAHTHVHAHVHAHVHTHAHTHAHTCTHTHAHTHTHP